MRVGSELFGGDQVAGVITSAATGPGGHLGLGYVKRAFEPPLTLRAGPGGPAVEVELITR